VGGGVNGVTVSGNTVWARSRSIVGGEEECGVWGYGCGGMEV